MNKPDSSVFFKRRAVAKHRMIGVVLPVVLIVLTVLTGLVVTQIRRGAIDERLAGNTRETVNLDGATQTVLRWCEARLILFPLNTVTVQPAPDNTQPPAWRVAANWGTTTNSLDFSGTNLWQGMSAAFPPACVIELATCELAPPIGRPERGANGCNGNDPRWMKFRITSRVATPAPDIAAGDRFAFAQSELRLWID